MKNYNQCPFRYGILPPSQLLVTAGGYFNGFRSNSDMIILFFFSFCAACLDLVQTDNDQSDYSVQRGWQQAVPV